MLRQDVEHLKHEFSSAIQDNMVEFAERLESKIEFQGKKYEMSVNNIQNAKQSRLK